MKKNLLLLALPLVMIACGGGSETQEASESNATSAAQASPEDMKTVEEIKSLESDVERINQDVDSIINNMNQ